MGTGTALPITSNLKLLGSATPVSITTVIKYLSIFFPNQWFFYPFRYRSKVHWGKKQRRLNFEFQMFSQHAGFSISETLFDLSCLRGWVWFLLSSVGIQKSERWNCIFPFRKSGIIIAWNSLESLLKWYCHPSWWRIQLQHYDHTLLFSRDKKKLMF